MGFLWDSCGILMKLTWIPKRLYWGSPKDALKMLQRFSRDAPKILKRFSGDSPWILARLPTDSRLLLGLRRHGPFIGVVGLLLHHFQDPAAGIGAVLRIPVHRDGLLQRSHILLPVHVHPAKQTHKTSNSILKLIIKTSTTTASIFIPFWSMDLGRL